MRKIKIPILWVALFACLSTPLQANDEIRVLVLLSLDVTYPYVKSKVDGLAFEGARQSRTILLDIQSIEDERYTEPLKLHSYFSTRAEQFRNSKPDIILVSGSPVIFDFYNNYLYPMMPDIPMVGETRSVPANHKPLSYSFIEYVQNMPRTIDIALSISKPKRIYLIGDATHPGSRLSMKLVEQNLPPNIDLPIERLDLPFNELLEKIKDLPSDSVGFFNLIFSDGKSKRMVPENALKQIAEVATFPIFAFHETMIGSGATGGYVAKGEDVGIQMMKEALMSLEHGPYTPPRIILAKSTLLFDANYMIKNNIDINSLPADAEVINKPQSLLEEYFYEFITAIVVIIIQGILLILLAVKNRQNLSLTQELESINLQQEDRIKRRTQELQNLSNRLSGLFDSMDSGIVVHNPDTSIALSNRKADQILGLQHDNIIGKTAVDPQWQFLDQDGKLLTPEHYPVNLILNNKDVLKDRVFGVKSPQKNNISWLLVNGTSIVDTLGSLIEIIISFVDITRLKLSEEALARSNTQLKQAATVFQSTNEGITITDINGTILDVNDAFSEITGYAKHEVIGQNPKILKSGRHNESFYLTMWESILQSGHWKGEIWNRRKDGKEYPELLTISSIQNDRNEIQGYVAVFSDITSIKQSQDRLDYLAHHDSLTNLPNRLLFNECLKQSIKIAERHHTSLAVIFIDLDRFKNVNDSLSHQHGDELLIQVSNRLKHSIRREDILARISGDEFVALLKDVSSINDEAITVNKIMKAFEKSFDVMDIELRMTCSLGISLYPDDGKEASHLLRNADAAMYRSKEEGRNTYHFYHEEMSSAALEHVIVENAMRNALIKEEFFLVYQPQYRLRDKAIVGMEALLRWKHPDLGMIPPSRFIPIAEQSGQIRTIGDWVVQKVCEQGKAWYDQGYKFNRIAINISGQQLQQDDFLESFNEVLNKTGMPADHLEIEVTETFLMASTDHAIDALQALMDSGIHISIDDFGTGYSSMASLKRLPVTKLKIDQSFVKNMPEDTEDVEISKAIIAMTNAMNLEVIAEGIETLEQLQLLSDINCTYGQGFYLSKPLKREKITLLLKKLSKAAVEENLI